MKGENLWPSVPVNQQALILRFEDLAKWDFKKQPYGIYVPGGLWSLPKSSHKQFGLIAPNEDSDPDETDDPGLQSKIFRWGWDKFRFEKYGYRLWVDELKDWFESPMKIDKYLKYHYTKGRFFDIGVWGATQEPRHLHSLSMSQASHFFCFDLSRREDRKKFADDTGAPEFMEMPGGYNFWYFERGWKNAVKGCMEAP